MAAAFGAHFADTDADASATTTALSGSLAVSVGDRIFVAGSFYADVGSNESATDNLGNTYTFVEHIAYSSTWSVYCLVGSVTTGGTLTSITVTHPNAPYRAAQAAKITGAGTWSAAGGLTTALSTTGTWCDNKSIPANGIAVGLTASNSGSTMSAGSASGSPSTSITLDTYRTATGQSTALLYAASASSVTGFSGTTSAGSINWGGAGAVFSPAAGGSTIGVDPLGMLGFFGG